MARKALNKAQEPPEPARTFDDISSDAGDALIDLSGALTAGRALVDLTLADGGSADAPVLYKRLNALEFVLRQAGRAEDILWVAIDKMSMSFEEK
ncbi:MAG TPA: hypothetical protein PKV67_01885 [Hyphomonas sp.]|uniref:Uncharacterized protein n=1 Tax=Hyphomonas polymorpha PS728 TaxID=1280954 RepID=A0A062VIU8_9PROT|nr:MULTISPECIES: hypothetical protein [Hyphomonas]KCZ98001.1 hypothetical protein HPO_11823 [Hyphomonas polymorpha PS728]MBA4226053.1 hypothetical protein [Hyphomonas sp.]HAY05054.1 hypothetical protein [Hyphomonas sp.]HRI99500.1 hypothetical protein [Hyphomonas sp.]HRK65920.1 hypothetical protein [Hyphomonas sp.]